MDDDEDEDAGADDDDDENGTSRFLQIVWQPKGFRRQYMDVALGCVCCEVTGVLAG